MIKRRFNRGLAILIMFCFLVGIPGDSLALNLSDKKSPQLLGASVIGTVLTLEFDELLKGIPARAPGLFTVKVNGAPQAPPRSAVAVLKTLVLNLAQSVNPGDRIAVSYQSGDRGIEDLAGNKTASFEDFAVHNHTPDLIPPILQEAVVNGTDLYLSYNEVLDANSLPSNINYSILINGQQIMHPATISITGSKVNLRLSFAVAPGNQVKISYAAIIRPIKDLAGNPALPLVLHPVRNITGQDLIPPAVVEASIDQDTLKVLFNEELDITHIPPATSFKVQVGAEEQIPAAITLDGCGVNLLLASPVVSTDVVNLSYSLGSINLCDRAGNEAAAFNALPVVNNTLPVNQNPEIVSAVAKDKTITVTYSQPLKPEPLPALSSFAIAINQQEPQAPLQVNITDAQLILTLAQDLKARDTLTLSYTPGDNPVQDQAGNLAPAQNAYPVQNQTEGDITPPQLEKAVINGSSVSLRYNEEVDAASIPDVANYTVYLDGLSQVPVEIQINQQGLTLILATPAEPGQTCNLDYTPGVHPLSDQSGNPAPSLHRQPLDNLTATLAAPPLDPVYPSSMQEATSFLYEGENPVQTGVAPDTIAAERVFLIRGKIKDRDNMALSGVKVIVDRHPEFGQTVSRSDGAYDMVVNGGGILTISYEKAGYLPAQRVIESGWEESTCLEDIVLVPYDTQATPVEMGGSQAQVAQGSVSADQDGQRQATLIIPAGTSAQMTLENGAAAPLPTATIRATEITVGENGPEAMIADLPGNVGYTYAVDFSVDEARTQGAGDVAFDRPIYNYVENFLDFPVGGFVPAAYYDSEKAAWIPSENGRIIRILAVENEEAQIDISGGGSPASAEALADMGFDQAELRQLAALYTPGQSLWRVPITHFSPWDYNWPFGPPADARAPELSLLSEIPLKTQILGRSQEITGTPFALYYSSERVPGYESTVRIPLSAETLPSSLKAIKLEINVAGKKITLPDFDPIPNQTYDFQWDGTDAYGRQVNTVQDCLIKIGYVYPGQYQSPAIDGRFGDYSGIPVTGDRNRCEVTIWQNMKVNVRPPQPFILRAQNLGGWTISPCHAFNPNKQMLDLGYGSEVSSKQIGQIINSVGGKGYQPPGPSLVSKNTVSVEQEIPIVLNIPLGQEVFNIPLGQESKGMKVAAEEGDSDRRNYLFDVVTAADGTIYVSDVYNNQIYHYTLLDNKWELFAGTGQAGISSDGGPAINATLAHPTFMDIDQDGNLYFCDQASCRVRKINRDGIISTIAGNGEWMSSGDGGPATSAGICYPMGLAVANDGSIYITEEIGNRIRRIAPDGVISTIAGTGEAGHTGDGGLAREAAIHLPLGIDVAADGSIYFSEERAAIYESSDVYCGSIRRIRPDGIIETVAGQFGLLYTGHESLGDGDLATNALVPCPTGIKVMDDGSILFGDLLTGRVRQIQSDGTIHTIGGRWSLQQLNEGAEYINDDGGPATAESLVYPVGVDLSPDHTIYVAEWALSQIRSIELIDFPEINQAYQVASQDGSEVFAFDARGRHLATYDALSGAKKYQFAYNEQGLSQIIDRDGKITNIYREADKIIIDGYGRQNELQITPEGYISSIKDPMNYTMSFDYDSNGLMTTVTDKKNQQYSYDYDEDGRLIRTLQPDGASITINGFSENMMAQVVATTGMGKTSTSRFEELTNGDKIFTSISSSDGIGKITKSNSGGNTVVSEDGTIFCSQEGPDPRWGMAAPIIKTSSITTPGGLVQSIESDIEITLEDENDPMSLQNMLFTETINGKTSGRVFIKSPEGSIFNIVGTYSAEGRTVLESLNDKDRVVKTEIAGIEPISYEYYSGEHEGLLRETRQGERVTSYTYDSLDRLIGVSDTLGHTTSYTYNNNNQMIAMTMPDGNRYQYHYDPSGLCDQIVMPDGAIHAMSYTVANLDESYTPPENSSYVNQYDQDQYPIQIKLPSGKIIRTEYYPDGRPSKLIYDSNQISLSYKGSTDLVQEVAVIPDGGLPSTTIQYNYDGSLLTSQLTSGPGQGRFDYRYNNDFLLAGITLNGGPEILLQYDNDGLLITEGSFNIRRDGPAGSVSEISDGNLLTTFQYNSYGQLWRKKVSVAEQQVYLLELGYDPIGRINSKVETSGTEHHNYSYTYDANGQLQSVTRDGAPYESYQYDQNGNRISTTVAGEGKNAAYDQQDRLQRQGDTDYQFDQDGFLQRIGETSYNYSAVGELQSITTAEGQTTYSYDGTARRVARIDEAGSTEYLYGNPDEDYEITAVRRPGGQIDEYTYDPAGILQSIKRDGQTYYVACDNLGSPKLISDSSGNITKALEYDSYGRITADSNPGFTLAIGYAGGLNDHNGLIRFGARDYDPDTGRWTAKDPLLFEGGQGNLYAYVANDPINKTDPEGTFALVLVPVAIELSGEAIAVIAGFATAVIMAANKDSIYNATNKEKSGRGNTKARDIIGKEKKGEINREFPKEWENKTLNEIEKAAKQGNKSAKKAKKLLNDKRFDKGKK